MSLARPASVQAEAVARMGRSSEEGTLARQAVVTFDRRRVGPQTTKALVPELVRRGREREASGCRSPAEAEGVRAPPGLRLEVPAAELEPHAVQTSFRPGSVE